MYVDAFNYDLNSRLVAPTLDANSTYCLQFAYATFFPDSRAELNVVR